MASNRLIPPSGPARIPAIAKECFKRGKMQDGKGYEWYAIWSDWRERNGVTDAELDAGAKHAGMKHWETRAKP